jgi:hypothetical protein
MILGLVMLTLGLCSGLWMYTGNKKRARCPFYQSEEGVK